MRRDVHLAQIGGSDRAAATNRAVAPQYQLLGLAIMRLTSLQVTAIREATAEVFGGRTQVWLFGSRVDDSKRGGDIDLLVRPGIVATNQTLDHKLRFLAALERRLGERKIDVVIETVDDTRPIIQVARQTGVKL